VGTSKYLFSGISRSSVSSINATYRIEVNDPLNPVNKPKNCYEYLKS